MNKPVIKIVRASTGDYLYKLSNESDFHPNWRFRYFVLNIKYIFDVIEYFA